MWEDPIVTEVRRVREQLSAKFGFDVKAIFADIERRQLEAGARLVRQKKILSLPAKRVATAPAKD
jgi:hypothetical protein